MECCRARILVQFPTAFQVFLRHQVKYFVFRVSCPWLNLPRSVEIYNLLITSNSLIYRELSLIINYRLSVWIIINDRELPLVIKNYRLSLWNIKTKSDRRWSNFRLQRTKICTRVILNILHFILHFF